MSDWRRMSAGDLGRGIRAGRIDPVELTEHFLEAIAGHEFAPRIHVRTTPERALAEAAAARGRARAGETLGPLDGVPISWKDLFDTAGVPTEAGSRLLAGRTPTEDAEVVRRGAAAGTVCLGKTHLSELAFSGLGINPMAATSPNIHDPTRAPGGSSSGAAASVAFGLAAIGIGSDTGGSVRIPSGWNDLVGLKTTAGLIPLDGAVPLAPSLDTVGPLCRTVEDAALAFAMLAGGEVPDIAGGVLADEAFAIPETVVLDGCDAETESGFSAALDRLGRAGARLGRIALPQFAETLDVAARLSAVVNYEGWREWGATIEANPGVMYAPIEGRFRSGEGISEDANTQAQAEFSRLSREVEAVIAEKGLLVMPTTACIAPVVADLLADEALLAERNLLALRNTRLGNLLRLSAITIPTGSPMVGLMIVGRGGEEARLLRAGEAAFRALA